MLAVPVAAAVRPAPEPVDAVWTLTLGHWVLICLTHRLNSGNRRLEPVSCNETDVVGQFSRLVGDAAAVVGGEDVVVEALGVDEPQAAARRPAAASTATTGMVRVRGRRRGMVIQLLCHGGKARGGPCRGWGGQQRDRGPWPPQAA